MGARCLQQLEIRGSVRPHEGGDNGQVVAHHRAGIEHLLGVSDLAQPAFAPDNMPRMRWLERVNPVDYATLQQLVTSVTDVSGAPVLDMRRVDQSEQLAPVLDQQEVSARVVTLVALTVGGLGILGVGLASVRERAKDFGLRRALGASKLRIFSGVIVQTLLAAIVAIFIAAFALELYARDLVLESLPLRSSTALPVSSAVQGLVGALLVGLVAGLIPAFSAARASVVQALKGIDRIPARQCSGNGSPAIGHITHGCQQSPIYTYWQRCQNRKPWQP